VKTKSHRHNWLQSSNPMVVVVVET